ncbi:MAG TPA: SpoIIE family protein phosphatase [bacterium]|nr:SpoIIE family protein phosphatase [bacterium]HPN30485.1 SpoIIE family protein phosphatase [bacterium]
MNIKQKFVILIFIILSVSVAIYTQYSYNLAKTAEYDRIDEVLRTTAYGMLNFVGDAYHDKIEDSSSITDSEYKEKSYSLTNFAKNINALYLYTYVQKEGRIFFTSLIFSDEQIKTGEIEPFFYEFTDDTAVVMKPLLSHKIEYEQYEDINGAVRSVFIPRKTMSGKEYVIGADFAIGYVKNRLAEIRNRFLLIGCAIFIAALAVAYILISRLSKPLNQLTVYTNELVTNDFKLSENSQNYLNNFSSRFKDEVGVLSGAFLTMQNALQKYIVDLRETTASKERIQSELKVAHSIQMSILPKNFPDRKEFELTAFMQPAKEVGGDLYDFFFIDDDYYCFVIGDVSGKGVPAALFMAVTKTLIKATAMTSIMPAKILEEANNELSKDNDNAMFCTLFCGVLHIPTGEINYSSAGHNPPLIIRKDKKAEYLKNETKCVALGVWEGYEFKNEKIKLNSGDTLYLYTDGVTEAVNPPLELYSEPRLQNTLDNISLRDIKTVCPDVMNDILKFADGADQADDITMLVLRYS